MGEFSVYIITNSNSNLALLKFPDFEIMNVRSEQFKTFCTQTNTKENEFLEKINDDYEYDETERYAIVYNKIEKFGARKIINVYNFILLLFPSTLTVEYILDYQVVNDHLRYLSSYHHDNKFYGKDDYLLFDENDIEQINIFIKQYYKNHLEINYLKSSILHYTIAFDSNYTHFSFIAFCICLESITNGDAELIYRISRNIAIICGKDEESSEIIFKNIKNIYKVRSKIVHGSEFSDETVSDYLHYLELICSKLIVELLKHGIQSIDKLNEKITSLGYGKRDEISSNWKETNFNKKIEDKIYTLL